MKQVWQSIGTWGACLAIFLAGIAASVSLGARAEKDAYEQWINLAESEANKATEIILFQFSQIQSAMHAVEAKFANVEDADDEHLLDILFQVDGWNISTAPVALAFAEKIHRDSRLAYEAANGTVSTVSDPDTRAPEVFESFVVTQSSDSERVLRLNMDMTTYPKMKSVVSSASRLPDQAVIGPAFLWKDGHTYSVIALNSYRTGKEGLIIGLLDLDDLYQGLVNVFIPEGLVLRLFEREGDNASVSTLTQILGPEKVRQDTLETLTIRFTEGQARWELLWDVLPDFRDGPNTGYAEAIRYGGSGMTVLFTLFLGFLISRNTKISAIVKEQTGELQDEKERLRLALKGGDLGTWDVDLRTGKTQFNARWANTFGYKIDEVQDARSLWLDTIYPEDRERVHEIGQRYRSGQIDNYEIEYRVVTKNKEIRWVMTKGEAVEFDDNGKAVRMAGTMSDITARKEIEQELSYQRNMIRALTDNLPHFVCMTDVEGRFQFLNRRCEEWLSVEHEELLGKTSFDFYSPEEAQVIRDRDLSAIQSGEIRTEEIEYLYPDGVERTVIMIRFPVKDSTGTVVGLGNINFDISERKQMEAALNEAKSMAEQANQAKSDFLASMSHELRTPLNAILGFSQLMEYNPAEPLTDTQKENVGYIQAGGKHLLSLINDILDLAKIEAGKADLVIEDISVLNILDECMALISTQAEKRGIDVLINHENAVGINVRADNVRLNQVLLNLLSNAVKYNRENGSISVSFKQAAPSGLRINITDIGEGIPDDKAGELFKPFSRLGAENTDIEGTGIGLVVTKELVERMGGAIGFDSTSGVGTTFWIEMPLAGEQSDSTKDDDEPDKTLIAGDLKGVTGKLLYVEDDVLHAKLLEALVSASSEIEVTIAPDGHSALDAVEYLSPDIVFVDIKLPDMSGYDVVQHLRTIEKMKNTPIYALTVAATETDRQKGLEAGFTGYLTKPLQYEKIAEVILKVV